MTKEEKKFVFDLKGGIILLEGKNLIIKDRDTDIEQFNINLFLIVDPKIILFQYYYPNGVTKIVLNQPVQVTILGDHLKVGEVKDE